VVVVSGGARGITSWSALALARAYGCRFVLLGRTEMEPEPAELACAGTESEILRVLSDGGTPLRQARATARAVLAGRAVRETLKAMADIGSEARYISLDVRSAAAVEAAMTQVRGEWGRIDAVLHGAGVPAGELIGDKSDAQFDTVFDTKVAGLSALLRATEPDELRLLVAFSSVIGRAGYPGQCDYAMANATMDHVLAVEAHRRPRCLVKSIQWGPWEGGGMVGVGLRDVLIASGATFFDRRSGTAALLAELGVRGADPRVLLSATPLDTLGLP
jgi:NAD(P)-dependent dehydrogenase (short-subunit alcohol dehydrogenase family)